MNAKEIKTFGQLKNEVVGIKEDLDIIKICLMGNPKKPIEEPGLVGIISNGHRWRMNVNKSLVYLIPVSTLLLGKALWTWILGLGK